MTSQNLLCIETHRDRRSMKKPHQRIVEDKMKVKDRLWKERPTKSEIEKQNGSLSCAESYYNWCSNFTETHVTRVLFRKLRCQISFASPSPPSHQAVAGMNRRHEAAVDFRATLKPPAEQLNTKYAGKEMTGESKCSHRFLKWRHLEQR
ncbi:hypothetical protein PoB_000676800 [Plakobranchus ocellatus]|uniref:Uncharacterized protein n=1 Tax=Plakobranchus ocellatus TaxID=259542 RepID=A0AAV3YCW0_9GAST|nr:hypothetical protein PoB_000676800 [Plakobranchus ocellatus]